MQDESEKKPAKKKPNEDVTDTSDISHNTDDVINRNTPDDVIESNDVIKRTDVDDKSAGKSEKTANDKVSGFILTQMTIFIFLL